MRWKRRSSATPARSARPRSRATSAQPLDRRDGDPGDAALHRPTVGRLAAPAAERRLPCHPTASPGSAGSGRRRPRAVGSSSAAGRPPPTTCACASAATDHPMDGRRLRRARGDGRRRGRRRLRLRARRARAARPRHAAGSPTACAARAARSTRRAFAWTDAGFETPRARGPRHLRAARRHLQRRGDLRRRDRAPRRARRPRRQRDRGDARRRVPRRRAAGATTASTSPRRSPPTAARTGFQRLVDAAHAHGHRGDPRRRLQPRRRVRQHRADRLRARTTRTSTRRSGARR